LAVVRLFPSPAVTIGVIGGNLALAFGLIVHITAALVRNQGLQYVPEVSLVEASAHSALSGLIRCCTVHSRPARLAQHIGRHFDADDPRALHYLDRDQNANLMAPHHHCALGPHEDALRGIARIAFAVHNPPTRYPTAEQARPKPSSFVGFTRNDTLMNGPLEVQPLKLAQRSQYSDCECANF
jgi:hypothetical protein